MKRTFTVIVPAKAKTITETLPPGRYLKLGEILEKGDLVLRFDQRSYPVGPIQFGLKTMMDIGTETLPLPGLT